MNRGANPNPEQPDKDRNEDKSTNGEDFTQPFEGLLDELLSDFERRSASNAASQATSLEEQLRLGLIENRTKELTERYSEPAHTQRLIGIFSGALETLSKLMTDQGPSELGGEDSSIEGDDPLDGVAVLSHIVNSRMFAAMTARQAATNEYMTEAERNARRAASLENLQDAGIPTNSLEKVAQESVNKDRAYEKLLDRVFAKLLIVAETEGLEEALKPETRNQIIRSMVTRDVYMEMRLAKLERMGEVINGLQDAGRLSGGETGEAIESLGAAMSDNGQLERLEGGAIRDIVLDARAIFGS